jgi:hypothetical protein
VHFPLHQVRVGREGDREWRQGVSDGVGGKFTHDQLDVVGQMPKVVLDEV